MPLNDNCLLGVLNRADAGALTAGTASPSFPASNLRLPDLSRPWRSTNATAPAAAGRDTGARTWVELDMGQGYVVQMVALVQHNLTQGALWRVRLSDDPAFGTDVYDTGQAKAWPTVAGFGSLSWGVFEWGNVLSPQDAALFNISSFMLLPNAVSARYCRVEVYDAANPKGYVQAGRLFCGPVWQPSINMELDWSIGFEDPSEESRALGGSVSFDRRPVYRVASFVIGHLPEAEAHANILNQLDRRKGRTGDLIFIPQPMKPDTFLHEAIYGRQRRLDPLRNPYVDSRRARGFEIEELR